jgi:hypothetical protein
VAAGQLVVGLRPFDRSGLVGDQLAGRTHRGLADVVVELDHAEPVRGDVDLVDRVAVDHERSAIVDRLEEGVAESLDARAVGDEIGVRIDVRERVDGPAIGRAAARVVDDLRFEPHRHVQQVRELHHPLDIVVTLFAARVRHDQLRRDSQTPGQLDGVLDALALDDPGRLEDEHLAVRQAEVAPGVSRVVVGRRGLDVVVHDVGDDP